LGSRATSKVVLSGPPSMPATQSRSNLR
jgi:hypothetical protein